MAAVTWLHLEHGESAVYGVIFHKEGWRLTACWKWGVCYRLLDVDAVEERIINHTCFDT